MCVAGPDDRVCDLVQERVYKETYVGTGSCGLHVQDHNVPETAVLVLVRAVLLGVRRPEQSDFLEDAVLRGAWGLQEGGSVLGALQGFVRAGP